MAKLTFINHASYVIESDDSLLIVDPWVEGGAFDNGWSLLDKSITNKMLVEYLTKTDKAKFIWLSHEHSDHFSVPFLKALKETKVEVKFLFQKTLDGRVAQFIKKMGFSITESNDKLEVLDSELSIATFPYAGGDSYSLTMLNEFSILNINDCVVDDEKGVERVLRNYKKYTNNIDLLLTQFGYANWMGNQDEVQIRKESAQEKLNRISLQVKRFEPKAVIPFASFVYFCDPENFHTNDSQNTPEDVANFFEKKKILSKLIVLKPWDSLDLTKPLEQDLMERDKNIMHWVNLYNECVPQSVNEKKVSIEKIKESYALFKRKIFKQFLVAPSLLERFNFLVPIKFYLHDLDVNVILSYREGIKIESGCKKECDISLSATTLQFILMNEYGANTTHVNGKFDRISDRGVAIFSRHFAPQEYMKMGYGLKHPFTTLRIVVGKFFHKLRNKAWDVNPTAD
jgi:UDP-MurNAc hydroxylase